MQDISDRGFQVLITELDVFDLKTPASIAVRDQMVADLYSRLLDTALENKAVVTWGMIDRYTWLTPRYDPHFVRSDRLPSRPLLFDDGFHPKPSFWATVRLSRTRRRESGPDPVGNFYAEPELETLLS